MPIIIKSNDEIAVIREGGRVVAEVLAMLVEACRPGIATRELDAIVNKEFERRGVLPTFLGYQGYPARVCVSVNEQIVHGIPGERVLREGDIVSLDLGATYKGFIADAAVTAGVGRMSPKALRLIEVTREALAKGIAAARAGVRLGEVSHAIQRWVESQGFSVIREYVGHGVGRSMHEEPQVPNFGLPDRGPVLRRGMVLALEPMVSAGDWRTRRLHDGWTVVTADGSLAAHFEHTIAVADGGADILTAR